LADRALWTQSLRTARAESAGMRPSLATLRRDSPDLPAIPTRMLTAGGVSGPNLTSVRRVHEAWRAAVARSSRATYTNIPTSGHLMSIDAPDVVLRAIIDVLDELP
jgi:pimeloyl-ACP methyl ester carboxylesterase